MMTNPDTPDVPAAPMPDDHAANPDGVLSMADRTIDPDAPVPNMPEGAPVDPDIDPDADVE